MRKTSNYLAAAAAVAAVFMSGSAVAQSSAGRMTIAGLSTGWNSDTFGISTAGITPINPAGCPLTDLYEVESGDPGYKTFYAAALTAYTNGTPAEVIVSNSECRQSRPKIMGINLLK